MRFLRLFFLALLIVMLVALLTVALFANPAQVTLNVMYGITGFAAGFLYATHIYMGLGLRRRGPRGLTGEPGSTGDTGATGPRGPSG